MLLLRDCENVRYTLGHVFDKDYTAQDRSKPYIDHIAIRRELVPQYAKDGVLQISIELDVQVVLLSIIFQCEFASLLRICSGFQKSSNGQLEQLVPSVCLG